MIRVLVLCGFPGSRKTTWARQFIESNRKEFNENIFIVSFDSIREMLNGKYVFKHSDEYLVRQIALKAVKTIIESKATCIIDDCLVANTRADRARLVRVLRAIGHIVGPLRIGAILFNTPIEECLMARMHDTKGLPRENWEKAFEEITAEHTPFVKTMSGYDTELFDFVEEALC